MVQSKLLQNALYRVWTKFIIHNSQSALVRSISIHKQWMQNSFPKSTLLLIKTSTRTQSERSFQPYQSIVTVLIELQCKPQKQKVSSFSFGPYYVDHFFHQLFSLRFILLTMILSRSPLSFYWGQCWKCTVSSFLFFTTIPCYLSWIVIVIRRPKEVKIYHKSFSWVLSNRPHIQGKCFDGRYLLKK